MKRNLTALLGIALAGVMLTILWLLPIHAFFSTWLGTVIGPLLVWKSWKELLLVAVTPLAIMYVARRPGIAKLLWGRLINKLVALFIVLSFVMTVITQASTEAALAGLAMELRFLACFLLAQIVAAGSQPFVKRLQQRIPGWFLWITIALSILAILQVFVLPHNFLTHFGYGKATIAPISTVDNKPTVLRAFATMRGPNTLGAYLLIPLTFLLSALSNKRRWLTGVALLLLVITLLLTSSRSAWLGAIAAIITLGLLLLPRQKLKQWARLAMIPGIVLLLVGIWATVSIPSIRLAVLHSSAADENPALLAGSSDTHWRATLDGLRYIAAHPLGTGVGSAGPASFYNTKSTPLISENYYVQVGEELGVLGLALFLAINFLVARQLLRTGTKQTYTLLASFIGLSVVCIFLHGWADDPTAMTWWMLAGFFLFK